MQRKPIQDWMLLLTYLFVLIILTIHSGYLCKKIIFIGKQFLPVVFAGILAWALNRPYKYIYQFYKEHLKIPDKIARIAGLFAIYLTIIGVILAAVRFALPRFMEGIQQFIKYREVYMQAFEKTLGNAFDKIGIHHLDISPFTERIANRLGEIDSMMAQIFPKMAQFTTEAFRVLAMIGIVGVLSFYILYDAGHIKTQVRRLYEAVMPEKLYVPVRSLLQTAMCVFDNFITGQLIESFILGAMCGIGMLVLRLEYSTFVSLIVGFTAFIPFFGAYIGGGLGTMLLLFVSFKKALTFLVFFIVLQQVENNLIYPRVVGKRTGLPALWVLASVTIGGGLFGVAGMILSVPVATFFYVLLRQGVESREIKKNARQNEKNDI